MRSVFLLILFVTACVARPLPKEPAKGASGSFCCEKKFAVKLTTHEKPTTILVFAGYLPETGDPHFICIDSSKVQVRVDTTLTGPFFLTGPGKDLRLVYFTEGEITVPNDEERQSWLQYLKEVEWQASIPDELPEGRPSARAPLLNEKTE